MVSGFRGRWDLAILTHLTGEKQRPTDLLAAINTEVPEHQLSWKVMSDRLRHLETAGYVRRSKARHDSREIWYQATALGLHLVTYLEALDAWHERARAARADSRRPGPAGHNSLKTPGLQR
jgi:DNA-binding HxlR family transcriptional regulator